MKVVQMTLDEELVTQIDQVVKHLGTTRSAFAREALRTAIERIWEQEQEQRHKAGYSKYPVKEDEFSIWEDEQVWVD